MGRLLAVNVGLPRDVDWQGKVVHTAIWKQAVAGRCRARRLNLDGDGQGDLAGHGGEQRAVFVYQIEAYRYWEARLGQHDFSYGQFGENFTIEGWSDEQVHIGDRYQIGSALFEVTQPRVTCYRVGIRMAQPQMAAWLTASGKPGFYLRVLQEGEVGAGDAIVKVGGDRERLSVAAVNALLYSPGHPIDQLERALRIQALSPGWRASFEALLRSQRASAGAGARGNAGLAPPGAVHPAAPGFRSLEVAQIQRETDDVVSLALRPPDERPLTEPLPGQFVVLRLRPSPDAAPLFRSYSLSGPPSSQRYRISVKIEPHGVAGAYLSGRVQAGDRVDVSAPRGSFVSLPGDEPVVLLSAGIGATPLLAMLHALAASGSNQEIWWLHGARSGQQHVFAREAHDLIQTLARGRSHICYSRPEASDVPGRDFDGSGHLSAALLDQLKIPRSGHFYLCGPSNFLHDLIGGLQAAGIPRERVHAEIFAGAEPQTPGVVGRPGPAPHPPAGPLGTGALVSFARSGVAARWRAGADRSVLELAEACAVPVRWSCRTGVCHSCESGLVSGAVAYDPAPLDPPADGNVLICCAQPLDDVVIDI